MTLFATEDLFTSIGINQSIFEKAFRNLKKKCVVVYKKRVKAVWVGLRTETTSPLRS